MRVVSEPNTVEYVQVRPIGESAWADFTTVTFVHTNIKIWGFAGYEEAKSYKPKITLERCQITKNFDKEFWHEKLGGDFRGISTNQSTYWKET